MDPELLRTFDKLGIPLAEQKRLSNVAVDAVFDSVSIATTFREELAKSGVIFCSFSEAVKEHPELIRKHLGSVVPAADNYFSALNAAVFRRAAAAAQRGGGGRLALFLPPSAPLSNPLPNFPQTLPKPQTPKSNNKPKINQNRSDGSFVYIPKGVRCPMELSTYFRINTSETGQFERTLIVAEDDSHVSYLEGCTAPAFDKNQLHAAVVELSAGRNAEIKYSTVQNWRVAAAARRRRPGFAGAPEEGGGPGGGGGAARAPARLVPAPPSARLSLSATTAT